MSSPITLSSSAGIAHYGTDRRKAERSATKSRAILRFQDRLQVIQGSICDISVGGAGFICQQTVASHSRCTLQFDLPVLNQLASQAVTVPVTVISSMKVVGQAYEFRINLQFVGLPPKIRSHIEAFIRQSLRHG